MKYVYVVEMQGVEEGWVAGIYATETDAREQARIASVRAGDHERWKNRELGSSEGDPMLSPLTLTAIVTEMAIGCPINVTPEDWDFAGDPKGMRRIAEYRCGEPFEFRAVLS